LQCGGESFRSCAEVFKHGAGILKGHRPTADDGEETSWPIVAAKQKNVAAKNNNNKKHKTETANVCTQNTLESKIDIVLTLYTCQTKIMVHST